MTLRLAFVTGATPDRWVGRWRERRDEALVLVPVEEEDQLATVLDGEVDLALVRLRAEQPLDAADLGLHLVRLYDEVQVAVLGLDRELTLLEELTTADLAGEPQDWAGVELKDAVATVAAGTGVLVLPQSVARLHHRRDVTHRPVVDLPSTAIAVVWRRDRDDERTQAFVAITRGRRAGSSRDGEDPEPPAVRTPAKAPAKASAKVSSQRAGGGSRRTPGRGRPGRRR